MVGLLDSVLVYSLGVVFGVVGGGFCCCFVRLFRLLLGLVW